VGRSKWGVLMGEAGAKLAVLAPLSIEALALGPSGARSGPVTIAVRRLGMGLQRAAASTRRLSPELAGVSAIAVAGIGGGLGPQLPTGTLVVADRLLDASGSEVARLPSAPLLAGELRRDGLDARTGAVVSTDHIVTGPERAALGALGAIAVDMESAAVAHELLGGAGSAAAAGGPGTTPVGARCPLAVVRAISDTPGAELFSAAGLAGVLRALRALRAARPALARWGAAAGGRDVLLAGPRSFCAGVERAIETVEKVVERYGAPVYVRRQIVHNSHVVSRLEDLGAIFVEELDEVPDGARVVFSAHGVGSAVREEAARRGMAAIDATCPLVAKVHTEARRFANAGRQVILVGHAGHDEVEGTLGSVPGAVLVTSKADVEVLDLDPRAPTAVVTQTTLATDQVSDVLEALAVKFSDLARPSASDICYASQNRQEAVRLLAPQTDLILVIGSANSSNSNRLVEVARRCGVEAHLVEEASAVHLDWLAGARRVGVTAGASAPHELVTELVDCLAGLGPVRVTERVAANEHVNFPLPPEVR
jgi:4-hydroxy-3-methylbut-2-enyl diphosphate reductase